MTRVVHVHLPRRYRFSRDMDVTIWRESDHPRVSEGSSHGGEFTKGGGGGEATGHVAKFIGKAGTSVTNFVASKFKATEHAAKHSDPSVTEADILKHFPPDTGAKIQAAAERADSVTSTAEMHKKNGTYTPERLALHNKIAGRFLSAERVAAATPPPGQAPTFTLLGGRGGSGKSWFKGKVYDPEKAIVLDPDEIKTMLPEYAGWNAAQLHDESNDLFTAITRQAVAAGLNVVHDATMRRADKISNFVNTVKDNGYRIEVHYMFLPPQEAAKRGVARFLEPNGRFVPPKVILNNTTNEAVFDQVKDLADAWSFRDNNVGRGQEPKLLAEYKK